MRALARSIHAAHGPEWSIDDAMAFADALIADRYLEVKSVGIEVLARYRRDFTPRLLPVWKRWLAGDHSANWATTDAICGYADRSAARAHPRLGRPDAGWARHRNMWVRRASAVGLIPSVRAGRSLDLAYDDRANAARRPGRPDSESGRLAAARSRQGRHARLERYLRAERSGDSANDAALRDRTIAAGASGARCWR